MEVGTAKESHPVRAVNRACGPFFLLLVASCAGGPGGAPEPGSRGEDLLLLNRVTWGANPSSARALARMGPASYLEAQLQPAREAALPPEVQAQVDAMTITQRPVEELAKEMESRRKGLDLLRSDDEKKAAPQAYQQELARILTGFSVNFDREMPKFIPGRHDYGDKLLLGHTIRGRGAAEVDEALDLLARHPATARFICRKLALFFVSDDPSDVLVEQLASTFRSSDGDIAAVLRELFASAEFRASLGTKFKDPVHYVVSAVRLAYDDKAILNAGPMINWLGRMGEPLYARPTPDGFALTRTEWASAGQMATRFEIARTLGYGAAGLFRAEGPQPAERPAFPQLANALYYESMQKTLAELTRQALDNATSSQEWNMLLLASPEFMNR